MSLTVDFPMPIDPVNPTRFGFGSFELFVMAAFVVVRRVRARRIRRTAGFVVVRLMDSARMRVHRARTASTFEEAV